MVRLEAAYQWRDDYYFLMERAVNDAKGFFNDSNTVVTEQLLRDAVKQLAYALSELHARGRENFPHFSVLRDAII